MPSGVFDAIKPYLDHYVDVHDVDYRRNIFIFIRYRVFDNSVVSVIVHFLVNELAFWLDLDSGTFLCICSFCSDAYVFSFST